MPSIKQIENRLGNRCASLDKVNLSMANAEKGKDKAVLRKLIREKATLDRDIRKFKRQLIIEKELQNRKNIGSGPELYK